MTIRAVRFATISLFALFVLGTGSAQAQYNYGGGSGAYGGGDEDPGFFIRLETILANPRNTDLVLATAEGGQSTTPLIPDWDDEASGRFAFGYRWASGNTFTLTAWNFDTDLTTGGSGPAGGALLFAIGPPVPDGSGGYIGDRGAPGTFAITSEIEAQTVDAAWSRDHTLSEDFSMEWSVGIRFAQFEETESGSYGQVEGLAPSQSVVVAKSNAGDMFGVRFSARGTYAFTESWSFTGSLAISMLDGEIESTASMTAPAPFGQNAFSLTDDSRSGSTRDVDLALVWGSGTGKVKLWFGWEQAFWDEIAADLARNFPGTAAPLAPRDSVTFSGYKLGIQYNF
jgi:hypothetical protein